MEKNLILPALVCPLNGLPLRDACREELALIRKALREGVWSFPEAILPPDTEIEAALVSVDGQMAYPVVRGIPIVLAECGLVLGSIASK